MVLEAIYVVRHGVSYPSCAPEHRASSSQVEHNTSNEQKTWLGY